MERQKTEGQSKICQELAVGEEMIADADLKALIY